MATLFSAYGLTIASFNVLTPNLFSAYEPYQRDYVAGDFNCRVAPQSKDVMNIVTVLVPKNFRGGNVGCDWTDVAHLWVALMKVDLMVNRLLLQNRLL